MLFLLVILLLSNFPFNEYCFFLALIFDLILLAAYIKLHNLLLDISKKLENAVFLSVTSDHSKKRDWQ